MLLCDLNEFIKLSAGLNYLLGATRGKWPNCLTLILDRQPPPDREQAVLLDVLDYLDAAYKGRRRRLGSLAVLHPLRAAAILVRARGKPQFLEILTELVHDKREDLPDTAELESRFQSLLKRIDPNAEWFLMERLDWLTRRPQETYFSYMGRLLDHAVQTPEILRAKLADGLDNVLDLRIDVFDRLPIDRFHETMFKLLFEKHFQGFQPMEPHPPDSPLNGADRLYRLFKSTVILSLIRQRRLLLDDCAKRLFDALATACMYEAQRIVLHIFMYHLPDKQEQRELVLKTMNYTSTGGIDCVTMTSSTHPLDGFLTNYFDHGDKDLREAQLKKLYQDKSLMTQSALAFVVLFQSFLDNPDFCMGGVSSDGLVCRQGLS
jgi:hypothetical protein